MSTPENPDPVDTTTQVGAAALVAEEGTPPSESLRDEYEQLADLVRKYRYAYYQEDAPTVSDAEFDELYRRLEEIEALHPELVSNDLKPQIATTAGTMLSNLAAGSPICCRRLICLRVRVLPFRLKCRLRR